MTRSVKPASRKSTIYCDGKMNKAIVVEPITPRGKALVVKRIAGGRYRVCCECTSVANAEYIRDALNKEEPDANQR